MQLPGPRLCPSKGVGQGHSQVVMTMHADRGLYGLAKLAYHIVSRAGVHDAHSIRDAHVVCMVFLSLLVQLL